MSPRSKRASSRRWLPSWLQQEHVYYFVVGIVASLIATTIVFLAGLAQSWLAAR